MSSEKLIKNRNERLPLQVLISYEYNHKPVTTFCSNLSQGGLFIETTTPLPIGSKLKVNFNLPMEKHSFTIESKVVWIKAFNPNVSDPGMGLEFENMDLETSKLIGKALVYFQQILGR